MVKASAWLLTGNLFAQALRLASSLILTRLLVPEAFGLMAVANTLYFGVLMFSDLGIWQSVARSQRGDDARFLGTAWSLQVARGVLLAIGILLLSGLIHAGQARGWFEIGTVYADPVLPPLVAAFAVCALVHGLESIRVATAQRDMAARPVVRLEILTQLATIVITVAAALLMRSVWALLIGTLCSAALRTVLSYRMLPGHAVRPCWDADAARDILGFGKWVFVSSVIGFLALQGEKLLLGAFLGAAAFGVFSIAANLFAALVTLFSTLNGRVIFPGLSEVLKQDDPAALARAYARMQTLADLVLGFLGGLTLFCGHWLIAGLYDPRYADAGWMLQLLAVGLVAMRYQVLEQLMFALGRPGWVTANNLVRAVSLVVLVPAGYALYGTSGAIAGVALSQFATWPLSLVFKRHAGLLTAASERGWPVGIALGVSVGWAVDAALQGLV